MLLDQAEQRPETACCEPHRAAVDLSVAADDADRPQRRVARPAQRQGRRLAVGPMQRRGLADRRLDRADAEPPVDDLVGRGLERAGGAELGQQQQPRSPGLGALLGRTDPQGRLHRIEVEQELAGLTGAVAGRRDRGETLGQRQHSCHEHGRRRPR